MTIHDLRESSHLRDEAFKALRERILNPPDGGLTIREMSRLYMQQPDVRQYMERKDVIEYFEKYSAAWAYLRDTKGNIPPEAVLQFLNYPPQPPPPRFAAREHVLALIPPEWSDHPHLERLVHLGIALDGWWHHRDADKAPIITEGPEHVSYVSAAATPGIDSAAQTQRNTSDEVEVEVVKDAKGRKRRIVRKKTTEVEDAVLKEMILYAEYANLLAGFAGGQYGRIELPMLGLSRLFNPKNKG